jgi:hypothetical protein
VDVIPLETRMLGRGENAFHGRAHLIVSGGRWGGSSRPR